MAISSASKSFGKTFGSSVGGGWVGGGCVGGGAVGAMVTTGPVVGTTAACVGWAVGFGGAKTRFAPSATAATSATAPPPTASIWLAPIQRRARTASDAGSVMTTGRVWPAAASLTTDSSAATNARADSNLAAGSLLSTRAKTASISGGYSGRIERIEGGGSCACAYMSCSGLVRTNGGWPVRHENATQPSA